MNRIEKHPEIRPDKRQDPPGRRWWAAPAAFLATLLALPVNAGIDIPQNPLTTGSRIAPNILFILDDSSSMGFTHMYREGGIPRITGGGVDSRPTGTNTTSAPKESDNADTRYMYDMSHVTNTLYYNPAVRYEPWMQADGTRMSGGKEYTSAYFDDYLADDERSLATKSRYFYVLKPGATDTSDARNYYRYEIVQGGGDIIQSERGRISASSATAVSVTPASGTLGSGSVVSASVASVPAGVSLQITIRNTTGGTGRRDINYRVISPSNQTVCSGQVARNSSQPCTVARTTAGQYHVELQRANSYSMTYSLSAERYTTNDCSGSRSDGNWGWVNCVSQTPLLPNGQRRSVEEEKRNFATWFSYHRTRMKAAKAGASEAFSALDSRVRVGFDRINNQANESGNPPRPRPVFPIPVKDGNDGRFVDVQLENGQWIRSRTNWYTRLFDVSVPGTQFTPLRFALDRAGKYFMRSDDNGPYGPQSGQAQFSCRQNFAILATDGYWNDQSRSPRFPGLPAGQKNADGTAGSLIADNPRGRTYRYNPGDSENSRFVDGYNDTLADVAMYYWKTDLREDLQNDVPSTDANPAFWQHMVTFGISIGLNGSKGWGSTDEVPGSPNWNSPLDGPTDGDADRIDDLLHAALNSRGRFVAASNPEEFRDGLSRALEDIAMRTSSASNVAANSVSLDAGTRVFNASYVSGIWTGDLAAREVTANGVSNSVLWNASIPQWNTRKIYTYSGEGGAAFPTDEQLELLTIRDPEGNVRHDGSSVANYIKGNQSAEMSSGGPFRTRVRLLGDIVGSSPAYVPGSGATPSVIYVGANDGMLHAFNAANGQEMFAYVPGLIDFRALSTLSSPDYDHRYFVDGPIVVSSTSMTPSRRILVGTLGRGGKGVFALDVTSPQSFSGDSIMWELGETPGQNMGLVLGRPLIARAQGVDGAVVVLGNGVNSRNERAVLLVVDASSGEVVREIDTGVGSEAQPNGLFVPTAVLGPDGRSLAYVYAGDMLGNVWKFDLTSNDPAEWGVTRLFTATDDEGNAQPITAGIAVATHPLTNKRWIFFGTGSYLTSDDVSRSTTQSLYGFMDEDSALAKDDLKKRTIVVTNAQSNGYPVRAFEAREALPADKKGWYIDLPAAGERIIQDAQVVSTFLITASIIPIGSACDPEGRGYINALDAFTGTSAGWSYFDLDNNPGTDDRVEGLPVGSVDVGVGMPTLPNLLRGRFVVGGSGGSELGGTRTLSPRWDRVSWREIRRD